MFDVTRVDRPLCADYAAPMSYSHNPLHPTTLYLSAAWWVENAGHADISMPPLPADLAGIERLRVTCPSSVMGPEGWIKVKTTRLGRLAVHGMHSAIPQNGMSVRSLSRDTPDLGVWLDLHTRHYTMTHLDNPVRDLSTEMAHDLFVGNDLHPAGLVAGFAASERMTGFSSLRTGQGGELELGWTGAPDRDDPAEVANLVSAVIAIADNENADTLEVEVDDTDPMLTRAIEYFEVAWHENFVTYESPLPKGYVRPVSQT